MTLITIIACLDAPPTTQPASLSIVQTIGELRAVEPVAEGVSIGLSSARPGLPDSVLIYALFDKPDNDAWDFEKEEAARGFWPIFRQLGPVAIRAKPADVAEEDLPGFKVAQVAIPTAETQAEGRPLFIAAVPIASNARLTVQVITTDATVIAEAIIEPDASVRSQWSSLEWDAEQERTVPGHAAAPTLNEFAGHFPVMHVIDTTPDADALPTFHQAEASLKLERLAEGRFKLSTTGENPHRLFHPSFVRLNVLMRWQMNGEVVLPPRKEELSQQMAFQSTGQNASEIEVDGTPDYARLGAKPGDRVTLELMWTTGGFVENTNADPAMPMLQQVARAYSTGPLTWRSNEVTWIVQGSNE